MICWIAKQYLILKASETKHCQAPHPFLCLPETEEVTFSIISFIQKNPNKKPHHKNHHHPTPPPTKEELKRGNPSNINWSFLFLDCWNLFEYIENAIPIKKNSFIWIAYSLKKEIRRHWKPESFSALKYIACWSICHIPEAVIGCSVAGFIIYCLVFLVTLKIHSGFKPSLTQPYAERKRRTFFLKKLLTLLLSPYPQLVFFSFKTSPYQLRVYDNFFIFVDI